HGAITLDARDPVESLLIALIATPPFQSLRRIRQLGPASLTFHGAESSRFTHALGVMAITRRAFDGLASRHPALRPHRAAVLCAALLHDIGHGPFSHTAEEIFATHHESWTRRIIQTAAPIRDLLDAYHSGLADEIISVYHHNHPVPLVWQLVSSQLDCDRLDYLMRDSHSTGASYGHLDLERILNAFDMDTATQQLVVVHKGQTAVEHYLLVRYFMYAQVYNHPKNLAATWVLRQAFERARHCYHHSTLTADPTVTTWLSQPSQAWSLADYLAADDIVFMYHLQRWQSNQDAVLADLCRRFLDRDLFKAQDVSMLSEADQQHLLDAVRDALSQQGRSPDIYSGLCCSQSRGYTLYQQGIGLRINGQCFDINQVSPVVEPLTRVHERTWLLYPPDLRAMVSDQLQSFSQA
ncbi:MAG: HD domain-containing protein, partial [Leptolyngbyaceae cyanobacterium]